MCVYIFNANTMSKRNKPSKHRICCFCRLSENNELEFGKFYEDGEIVTHYYCLLLSSNMQQRGKDDEGILGFLKTDIKKEISRGKRLVCSYCKKAGATLGCCNVKCKKIFHYPCGLRAGTLNQFFDEFRSYCIKHRPKQKIDARVKIELSKTNKVVCCICYDEVDPYDTVGTMWAPCCKKNAWFHRKCVQQLAMSAGYFFKCPLCNNKNLFQKAMSEFGIFIPSQDASWELVPNAFEELLYRHDQCNAPICLCPKGRKYTSCNAKWELALCRTCGSQGTHMACGQLKWANPVWECRECISILGKSKVTASSSTTKDTLQNVSDFKDSDSDISVGKDSPIPFTSSSPLISSASQSPIVKQRPGPRSFKLRQLKLIEEMQNNNKYQTNENINTMLDPTNVEKHSLQSTSTKESFMSVSNSVTASMFHNYEDSSNSSIWHSKSQLDKQVDIVTLDSDDDIIEASNFISLNNVFIEANESENCLSSFKRNKVESNKSDTIYDSSLLKIEKLLQENNQNQTDTNNSLISNLNVTEFDNLKKFSPQNKTNFNILDNVVQLNDENEHNYTDFTSNIKITNVVSLAPKEFENLSSIEVEQKINNPTTQNRDGSISNNSLLQPSCYHSNILKLNLKRKRDKSISFPIASCISEPKKLRETNSVMEETSRASHIPLHAFTYAASNKNNLKISNHNEDSTSIDEFHLQNKKQHIQIKQNCNKNQDIPHTSSAKCSLKMNVSNNIFTNNTDTNKENFHMSVDTVNEMNKISKNIKVNNNIKDCDEDGGISPVVESSNRSFTNDTRINCIDKSITLDHSKSKRSQIAEQWKPQNDVEMLMLKQHRTSNNKFHNMYWQGKSESTDSNYSQLIPEYVCLRDLKFRVSNINNLQMILYDKYSVNINMECVTTTRKNTTFDVPIKKVAPQCIFKTQNDTLLNFRSGNIYSNKDKNTNIFVNEYSEHDQDDIKENLDPVITIPCKNTKDDLLINATLVTNNPNIFTNNNNQSENKTVEHNDGGRNHETIRLRDDIKNNFDAITSCNHNYAKSIIDVEQNIQNLNFDDIIDKTYEIHHMKKGLKTDFKVSIDLKKIKCFVDDNPNLFSRYKKEDSKRCIQQANFLKEQNNIQTNFNSSEHVKNSSIDESKHDENFTLSTSKYVIKELTSHNTETEKN
ncbi:putative uncharacterized protein DDB_G0282133 isoform X2 [Bombus huntii]|uniref:putative uncharacterized protein DDB_G0282133 isoform X2 n=1 Tax=Bombus huntii TaxID=85661 RepID=UPI0021A97B8E|nr:putative uncharacterized protein DDB_G0282133 isoform X2 [Bombus huntii]